jgi:hypothetical protein
MDRRRRESTKPLFEDAKGDRKMRKKVIVVSIVVCVVAAMAGSLSWAQPQGRGERGQRGPGQGPGGRFDPERMRQMMEQRMKERLGVSDQEWQVIGPRLTKVMELNRQTGGGGMGIGRLFMRRGPQGQRGPGGDRPRPGRPEGQELTPVQKAMDELDATLENESAAAEEIKAKLTALRTAREKARQELAVAQQELRKLLTLRQEAQLVMMGLLN